jgi:kynureninase
MMLQNLSIDENFAFALDKEDPLSGFRERFYMPADAIYVDGNSLGLLSKDAEVSLLRVLNEWKTLGIRGWLEAQRPWFYFAEQIGAMTSALVGAKPEELMLTGTTTVNIHSLISSLYKPAAKKTKILADELNFPSDIYALKGQIKMKGLDPAKELILVPGNNGILDEEKIVEMMTDEVALIFLPSVIYRSGQLLNMEYLTAEAHKRNIIIGFDCCHSAGAVPHYFSQWGVDFAIFCSYKYLNGGPGCAAFLYLNKKHFDKEPLMAGWFGCIKDRQFDMSLDFDHSPNAGGWQISSPGILGTSPIEGAIQILLEAGISNIREKSLQMTSYLIYLVQQLISGDPYNFIIYTPLEPNRRSGHIAIGRKDDAFRINEALKAKGVIPDFRPPDIIRIAPIAIYNTYHEVWKVVNYLKEIIDNKEYEKFPSERKAIS